MRSMRKYNSFQLECNAKQLRVIDSTQALDQALRSLSSSPNLPLVIGEGSNLLLTEDLALEVWANRLSKREVIEESDSWRLLLGAGENWHQVVEWSIEQGIYGLENLALIPGTVGAAPVQNIGAYGVEVGQFVENVDYTDLLTQQSHTLSQQQCNFAYRDSIFKGKLKGRALITQVELRLPKMWVAQCSYGPLKSLADNPNASAIFNMVCQTRSSKLPDPKVLGNAGSFFKNPIIARCELETLLKNYPKLPNFDTDQPGLVKVAAGWLIDQCGLKGFSVGGARVHTQQALVLVNSGGASASDVLQLAKYVQQQVYARFKIQIEPEVRFIDAKGECDAMQLLASIEDLVDER